MKRAKTVLGLALGGILLSSLVGCCKLLSRKDEEDKGAKTEQAKEDFVAAIGFRPEKNGYAFKNTGGKFPATAGIVTTNVMVKLFGKEVCVGGNERGCRLTPPASEWMGMINRAMNGGQCEGMAVSSLTFFKGVDKASAYKPGAKGAHDLSHSQVAPLIGYYWAYQAVDPVGREVMRGRRSSSPATVLARLSDMLKNNELATIGIFAPRPMRGGHAVTPYAIEDRGNSVYWVRIYDNNYPNQSRYIEIDKDANTWRYDVAARNPGETRMPWRGSAESRSIVLIPLSARLQKAECPFCRSSKGRKTVFPARSAALSISDPEGRKVGYEGDKLVNEIPDAEVVDLAAFLEDAPAPEPVYVLPDNVDYEIKIQASKQTKADEDVDEADDDAAGVAVFGGGTAIALGHVKRGADEADTLSVSGDNSEIRFHSGSGKVPALRMAVENEGSGMAVRLKNMKADAGDEVELKLDKGKSRFVVQGGGKSTDSYDLQVKHVNADKDDEVVEQKAVKFRLGESHAVDVSAPKAAGRPLGIQRGRFVPKPKPKAGPPAGKDEPGASPGGPAPKSGFALGKGGAQPGAAGTATPQGKPPVVGAPKTPGSPSATGTPKTPKVGAATAPKK
jgi:hypothetical protein